MRHFLALYITTETMDIWRFAVDHLVDTNEMVLREQKPRNARQPANEHRRVLGGSGFILFI